MKGVYLKDKTGNKVVTVPYYRIGDLFLTTIATNPSSYLGGKWELFGPGRCLVCVDTSQAEFNSVRKTGGEKSHKLTIDEMPRHQPQALLNTGDSNTTGSAINWQIVNNGRFYGGDMFKSFGGDKSHNNLQPFITCYVWIRTA